MVHDALFPLNPAPQGLTPLMRRFCRVEVVHDFVREQLIAGTKAALAFVRAHHPGINLKVIGRGPPSAPDGGAMQMEVHYEAVVEAAESIGRLVEAKTDNLCRRQGEQ